MTQSDKKEEKVREKETLKAEPVSPKEKKLSGKTAGKLKFYGVVAFLSLLCAGFIWFLFKPDAAETVEGAAGINTTIPDAITPETMADKQKAYELEEMKIAYSKAETNVENIQGMLEAHQVQLLKDIAMLDKMYDLNMAYFKELSMYILAGKKKLAEVRAGELQQAMDKAKASGLPEDAQAARDLADQCERFEKKLYDLELTRNISLQMGPQIRLMQNNDNVLAERIQSTVANTIPLWKSQMVLALGMEHSRQATAAQSAVAQTTNELLKKNADMLKMGTIATAKEAERSIVDIETLQHTNEQLVSTLDEVVNIQREGAQKRKEAEVELGRIEGELKQKLMELRS